MSRRSSLLLIVFTLVTAVASAASLEPQMRAVEKIRGRKFTAEVTNVTIDRAELPKHLREQMAKSLPYSIDDWTTILSALQLVDGKTDKLVPQLIDLYQSQVLAYYDPHSRTYYSIKQLPDAVKSLGAAQEMLEQGVIVHELTHALQDQHFSIGSKIKGLKKNTDAGMAYHAVIEGEATLVMLVQMLEQSGVKFEDVIQNDTMLNAMLSAAASQSTGIDPDTPKFFAESLKFPYLQGLSFVVQAYKRGGWKAIDALHADPPRSTREILHPEEYFDKKYRAEAFVNQPLAKTARTLTTEHLGEFHWAFLAGAENARGWVNDRVTVAVDEKGAPTVLVETKWESAGRALVFAEAYEKFLRGRGITPRVRRDGAVVKVAYGADKALQEQYLP